MTTTKSSPANSLREARDKLRARVVSSGTPHNHKPVGTHVLDRIEVKHHILPELESGLSGLFVETEQGTTFRVEFAENCDSALASGLDVHTAHQRGLISEITMNSQQTLPEFVVTKDEYSAFYHASFALRERLVMLRRDLAEAEKFKGEVCMYRRYIEEAENALAAIDSMQIRASVAKDA
ncbi:hypothetical protein [Photobacterium sp. J15]|uniref:hypothetical protein n=1 Tax=Photobacterium sp. J15 TaxID=265901 RepID=UPI0007E416D0|nr:hypothetical protein [Photobacterium sp. J15]